MTAVLADLAVEVVLGSNGDGDQTGVPGPAAPDAGGCREARCGHHRGPRRRGRGGPVRCRATVCPTAGVQAHRADDRRGLEIWGGNGYVKTCTMTRLVRESPLNGVGKASSSSPALDLAPSSDRPAARMPCSTTGRGGRTVQAFDRTINTLKDLLSRTADPATARRVSSLAARLFRSVAADPAGARHGGRTAHAAERPGSPWSSANFDRLPLVLVLGEHQVLP